jgi:hypothetical protein
LNFNSTGIDFTVFSGTFRSYIVRGLSSLRRLRASGWTVESTRARRNRLARSIGEKGSREWLVYAHAPVKPLTAVAIDLPEFGKVTVEVPPRGAFYLVKEQDRSVSPVVQ